MTAETVSPQRPITKNRRHPRQSVFALVIFLLALAWVTILRYESSVCFDQVGVIEQAVSRFNSDMGRPPKSLQELVPRYLQAIPMCPVAHRDTYSEGFLKDGYVYCSLRAQNSQHLSLFTWHW
jgi:hypothetical protein